MGQSRSEDILEGVEVEPQSRVEELLKGLSGGGGVDLSGYATETYVDDAIDGALEVIANGSY